MAQLDEREFKLNFQIAAGMGLNLDNYKQTPYIQYAIYNEGYSGQTGETEIWKLKYSKNDNKISYDALAPLDGDLPDAAIKGAIAIDRSDKFTPPEDADMTGIPNILDEMNTGIVRVWQLDVDQPDAVIASNPMATKTVADKSIQFIK
jgi:hypothetical protein